MTYEILIYQCETAGCAVKTLCALALLPDGATLTPMMSPSCPGCLARATYLETIRGGIDWAALMARIAGR